MADKPSVVHKEILDIETYVPGKSALTSNKEVVKLSSNENPFGTSQKIRTALEGSFRHLHRYPDGSCSLLRKKIAETNNINADQIICSAGSDEIIFLLCQAYAGSSDEILCSENSFLMYSIAARSVGARVVKAEENDMKTTPDNILAKVSERTKILFIANPNNPTGTYINRSDLHYLRSKLPSRVLLVLDNAYEEFVTADDFSNGFELVNEGSTVVTRTFSKIYGLAALRLGWAYCPLEIVNILHRIRGPFNVSTQAQIAGIAALDDQEFILQSRNHNTKWRKKLTDEITSMGKPLGIKVLPSQANFLLVMFPENDKNADSADNFLQSKGIIVRNMSSYNLPHCLRISIGLEENNIALINALKEFMKSE